MTLAHLLDMWFFLSEQLDDLASLMMVGSVVHSELVLKSCE